MQKYLEVNPGKKEMVEKFQTFSQALEELGNMQKAIKIIKKEVFDLSSSSQKSRIFFKRLQH